MNTQRSANHAPALHLEDINRVASTPLPRDREPSHRLHEPDHLINTIDPITGHDISDVRSHPHLQDGKLTIYFESEQTMQEFLDTPLNHPYEHALGELPEDASRGG
jgi:YHS domain-containing protein